MDSENMVMPVAPAYNGNGGFGGFGDSWAWIIILLLAFGGGWGNGFGGGYGNAMLGYDFPWLLNGQNSINANTNSGFAQAATQSALGDISTAITAGFGNVQNSLCGGFAGVTAAVNGAQNAIAQQMYGNQIADLQSFNALQSQLAQCCCDNRMATADLKYTIANEACANRATSTSNTQAILDKLCQLELDSKDSRIADLERQLTMANLAASQTAQTAQILAGQAAEVDGVYNRLKNCPVGTYSVVNPTVSGCGCGSF